MPEIKAEDNVILLNVFVIPKRENRTNKTFTSAFLKTHSKISDIFCPKINHQ